MNEMRRTVEICEWCSWCSANLIDISTNKVIGTVDRETRVEILSEDFIEDDNIWDADKEFCVFRVIDTGQLGRYELTPGGYGEYTYDPDKDVVVYNTDDLDYFIRYCLDADQRDYPNVSKLIEMHNLDKIILGET